LRKTVENSKEKGQFKFFLILRKASKASTEVRKLEKYNRVSISHRAMCAHTFNNTKINNTVASLSRARSRAFSARSSRISFTFGS